MAVIALATANRVNVVGNATEQLTLNAAEAIVAGSIVRIDTAAGTFTPANGSAAGEARVYGVALKTVAAGEPVTAVKRGIIDGYVMDAMAYDADVFASNTDGAIDTAAGTVSTVIGKVVPLQGQVLGSNPNKGLLVNL